MRSASSSGRNFVEILARHQNGLRKVVVRYGLALLATSLALALRAAFDSVLGDHVQYLVIFPAVVFSAWYCGVGPSIAATAAAFLGETYWFIDPRGSFTITDKRQIVAASIYLLTAAFIITLAELNRRAMTKQKRFEQELDESRRQLEFQVQERTRELEQRNVELGKQAELVRELSGRLLEMRDEERRHIARELHDGLGQIIAAVHMNLSRITVEPQKLPPDAAKAASEAVSLTEQLSREVRTLSHLLHPPLLDELGLQSALRWYTEGFADRSKIKVTVEMPPDFGRLPRDLEMHIFRIVQECLTNVHRHSASSIAIVRLNHEQERVRLEVEDAGKGISREKQLAFKSEGRMGVGIRGMRERVRQFGGTLEIKSSPSGTRVIVDLPAAHASAFSASPVEPAASSASAG
jgi:signal transduction histidine kinase